MNMLLLKPNIKYIYKLFETDVQWWTSFIVYPIKNYCHCTVVSLWIKGNMTLEIRYIYLWNIRQI